MKKTRLKRVSFRTSMWKEIEDLHREAVMVRWGIGEFPGKKGKKIWYGACPRCRAEAWMQCSHIFPKGKYKNSRYDPDNAIPLCMPCHLFWWHKHPIEAAEWIRERLGADFMDRLRLRVMKAQAPDREATRLYLITEIRKFRRPDPF